MRTKEWNDAVMLATYLGASHHGLGLAAFRLGAHHPLTPLLVSHLKACSELSHWLSPERNVHLEPDWYSDQAWPHYAGVATTVEERVVEARVSLSSVQTYSCTAALAITGHVDARTYLLERKAILDANPFWEGGGTTLLNGDVDTAIKIVTHAISRGYPEFLTCCYHLIE